jgi:hypothetical protein
MAVASAVDELLRASWAELQVVDAPALAAPPPALPRRTRQRELPALELGMLSAVSMLPEREALGGDLFGALWLGSRTFAALRLGGAHGFPRSSAHGSARADDVHAALGGGFALVPREARFGVAGELGAVALRLHFAATPDEQAFAASQSAWAALASLGLRSWARAGPVRFTLGAAALRVLSPIRATDDGRTVVALEGFGAELTAGLALLVPGTGP